MSSSYVVLLFFFFFQAEDGIRDYKVTGVQTCALPILDVVADRFRLGNVERARAYEAIEVALKRGSGHMTVYVLPESAVEAAGAQPTEPQLWKFSLGLHCPESGLSYQEPIPSLFSFNSAVGACEACRGFGRVIGVDWGLVIPNDKLTLRSEEHTSELQSPCNLVCRLL